MNEFLLLKQIEDGWIIEQLVQIVEAFLVDEFVDSLYIIEV